MNITVIGCGRWGSFIAWYLNKSGHNITLYGRQGSEHMQELIASRTNGLVILPPAVQLSTDLSCVHDADIIIISVNSQGLRKLCDELKAYNPVNKIFVICMKGIEITTGKRLSEIVTENVDASNKVTVWIGPGHVQEFVNGIPNCMVIDSTDEGAKKLLVDSFSSDLIRFYYGDDLIGNEIGAAAKNVIGIAAGMLDGLNLSSLKGALMARGAHEVARLIKAMGGNELSAYGLCHLGDYEATVFSKFSHNRQFGENFIRKIPYNELAEGYYTVVAMLRLGSEHDVELPISEAVYNILYCCRDPREVLDSLFSRKLKNEFNGYTADISQAKV